MLEYSQNGTKNDSAKMEGFLAMLVPKETSGQFLWLSDQVVSKTELFLFALPLDKWLLKVNQNLSQVPLGLGLQFGSARQITRIAYSKIRSFGGDVFAGGRISKTL